MSDCPKPPRWGRLYGRHFPADTDPCSRHIVLITEALRDKRSDLRKTLEAAGCEPDHIARSMGSTVTSLWQAPGKLRLLGWHFWGGGKWARKPHPLLAASWEDG